MKSIQKSILPLALVLVLMGVAQACPTCKESVAENGGNLVRGYFWSIIFMMSMPFLILSGLCTMFYLDVRRAKQRKAIESESIEAEPLAVGSV